MLGGQISQTHQPTQTCTRHPSPSTLVVKITLADSSNRDAKGVDPQELPSDLCECQSQDLMGVTR